MDSELIKWLAQMPKNYDLSAHKISYYNGEKQLKLFLKIKDNQLFLVSLLIATPQTQNNVQPKQPPNHSNHYATQKTDYCNDFVFIFFFVCQLVRTRTHKRLSHPTPKREIIHARTLSTTPAPCGFFIVYWLHYPPHPTNTPRTKHHTHRPPHPQPTAGAGQQKNLFSI